MIDIVDEIQELIGPNPIKVSKWVKSMSTRMRVFNTQIFDNVYNGHSKDNAEMNYAYMEKTFDKLSMKAFSDKSISHKEYYDFCDQYEANIDKLHAKKFKKVE